MYVHQFDFEITWSGSLCSQSNNLKVRGWINLFHWIHPLCAFSKYLSYIKRCTKIYFQISDSHQPAVQTQHCWSCGLHTLFSLRAWLLGSAPRDLWLKCMSVKSGIGMLLQKYMSKNFSLKSTWFVPLKYLNMQMSHEPASPPSPTYSVLGFGDIVSSEPAPCLHHWEYYQGSACYPCLWVWARAVGWWSHLFLML